MWKILKRKIFSDRVGLLLFLSLFTFIWKRENSNSNVSVISVKGINNGVPLSKEYKIEKVRKQKFYFFLLSKQQHKTLLPIMLWNRKQTEKKLVVYISCSLNKFSSCCSRCCIFVLYIFHNILCCFLCSYFQIR